MLKLHLGCGKRDFGKEWVHIDAADYDHLHSHNVKKLPFADGTVDVIYASHLIAYFDRVEIVALLAEWHRVLKPGGTLRLATPDFWRMSQLYGESKVKIEQILGPMYGKMDIGVKIYHKTCWDYPSLSQQLILSGFRHVRRYDHEKTDHAHFDDHSAAYLKNILISLNVECNK